MSKSKYMEEPRKDATIAVVVSAEALTSYLFNITNNEKQFPKAYRYTLSKKIRNRCLKLNMEVYKGCIIRAYTSKEYKKVRKYQKTAYDALVDIKTLLNVAMNVAKPKNPEYIVKLYEEVQASFNHWVKNTNRSYRKAKWRESLSEEDRLFHKQRIINESFKKMDHDADGFLVLKRSA